MEEKKRCDKQIWDGTFKGHRCQKPFFATEDGRNWCRVHAHSTIRAKVAKRDALWDKERLQREANYVVSDARHAVVDVAKGWASDPKDEMNNRALKAAVDALLAAENKAKELS